jgi:ComF family protein
MIPSSGRGAWRKWLHGLWNEAKGWLAPPAASCLICHQTLRAVGQSALCPACSATIPWITSVYCRICGRSEPCPDCVRRAETFFVRNRGAVRYTPEMKDLLARYKYRGDERLLPLMADMLSHAYRMHLSDLAMSGAAPRFNCLTYVPLSEERQAERGFNQAEKLAEALGGKYGVPVVSLLKRTKHTDKQSLKTRKERLIDLKNAFEIDREGLAFMQAQHSSRGVRMNIMIIDDVYTTGSTLNECARTISAQLRADIYGLTWAR